jgi:hypothetical protein
VRALRRRRAPPDQLPPVVSGVAGRGHRGRRVPYRPPRRDAHRHRRPRPPGSGVGRRGTGAGAGGGLDGYGRGDRRPSGRGSARAGRRGHGRALRERRSANAETPDPRLKRAQRRLERKQRQLERKRSR